MISEDLIVALNEKLSWRFSGGMVRMSGLWGDFESQTSGILFMIPKRR
jgi:hypothetical protein